MVQSKRFIFIVLNIYIENPKCVLGNFFLLRVREKPVLSVKLKIHKAFWT